MNKLFLYHKYNKVKCFHIFYNFFFHNLSQTKSQNHMAGDKQIKIILQKLILNSKLFTTICLTAKVKATVALTVVRRGRLKKGLTFVQILLLLLLLWGEHTNSWMQGSNGPRKLRPNNFTKKPIRPIYCLLSL